MKQDALERAEAERHEAQRHLDRHRPTAERNRRGQFSTPARLALELATLAKEHLPPRAAVHVLDPGVGTGVFFYGARKVLGPGRLRKATGFEDDPEIAAIAQRIWGPLGLQVQCRDFCTVPAPTSERLKANLILCNPPYVRHHHLSAARKTHLQEEVARLGVPVNGLAGLYCYFLILAHRWLAINGVGVWIIPAEFLDVNYGVALKKYLTSRATLLRIHRFDPEDAQFADALVTSVVVVFRNTRPSPEQLVRLTTGGCLSSPGAAYTLRLGELDPTAKWGPLVSAGPKNDLVREGYLRIGDLFHVKRGIATGANEFFILTPQKAETLGLPACFLRPILPGPRYITDTTIERADDGSPRGIPERVLLDCALPFEEVQEQYPALERYLRLGERKGIPNRYIPRHRRPWYRQEQRPPAPIVCTYMGRQNGGRGLRFLRNRSAATAPNVYLLLYPKQVVAAAAQRNPDLYDRIFDALQAVGVSLHVAGRVYGGGLNKIEPRELERVSLTTSADELTSVSAAARERQAVFPFQQ